jgi:hypothetical protein
MPTEPIIFDEDNPEWTKADFAAAKGPVALPPRMLAAFLKTKLRHGPPVRAGNRGSGKR